MEGPSSLLRQAVVLSLFSVAWGGAAGAAALVLAYSAGSLSLLGLGALSTAAGVWWAHALGAW